MEPKTKNIISSSIRSIKIYWFETFDLIGIEFYDRNGKIIAGGHGEWDHSSYKEIVLKENEKLIGFKAKYGNFIESIAFKIARL